MIVMTVAYPREADQAFNLDYYVSVHMPRVRQLWSGMGLEDAEVLCGVSGPGGADPAILVTAVLRFTSRAAYEAALAKHGNELFADVPNFTAIKPVVQLNEVAWPTRPGR